MVPEIALQAHGSWHFDIRSAIVGALIAWILAAVLYRQRRAVGEAIRRVWEPVAQWRRRSRASQQEKYVRALWQRLKPQLLPEPDDLKSVFVPPILEAPAPLPVSVTEAATAPRTTIVPYAALLSGHSRLILTGEQGTGRTTAMAMFVFQSLRDREEGRQDTAERLPVWIDLSQPEPSQKRVPSAAERIVAMATAHLPEVLPQWLLQRLRRERCLLLLDNWELLSQERRSQVARWISEAAEEFGDAIWIVASAEEGYSDLVAEGFVPVRIVRQMGQQWQPALYTAWQTEIGRENEPPDEEALTSFSKAAALGAPLWELHLRVLTHLQTHELPDRPVEVIDSYIAHTISAIDLGKAAEQVTEPAQQIALETLVALAVRERLGEQPAATGKDIRDLLEVQLQDQPERSRRLEDAVRKILTGCGLVRHDGRFWQLAHPILGDYFVACHLAREETGAATIEANLDNPSWSVLTELYAGLADIGSIAESYVRRSEMEGDQTCLVRIARWAAIADPQAPSHRTLIKILARSFVLEGISPAMRLDIGRAIVQSAGESARAFFVQMLRNTSPDIRGAAIRGLGWCKSSGDRIVLASVLRDDKTPAKIRDSAARALLDLGSDEAVNVLAKVLPDVDEPLMASIADILASDVRGGEALQQAAHHPDLMVRRAAAFGLGKVDEDWAHELLLELAREDTEWVVRSAAELALQARDESEGLVTTVTPPPQPEQLDWLIGWAARQGEGLGIGEAAMVMLRRAAQEGNADAKVLSALTLAQIGRESEATVLESLMGNLDPLVAQTATWAVRQIRRRHQVFSAQ